MLKKTFLKQLFFLLILASVAGAARQFFPAGLSWVGDWELGGRSSREAYDRLAKPGDPPYLSLQEARAAYDEGRGVFIDVRSPDDFARGRIAGARNLPYYEIDRYQDRALTGVTAADLIVVYCDGIGCDLSFLLGRELQDAGYENVRIFYGGYPDWREAGYPLEGPQGGDDADTAIF